MSVLIELLKACMLAMLCGMQCNASWAVHVLILPGKGLSNAEIVRVRN